MLRPLIFDGAPDSSIPPYVDANTVGKLACQHPQGDQRCIADEIDDAIDD